MQHLQPDTTLQGGKYRIERMLGQGGFGITYLAIQTSLNRYVAIKELFIGGSGQAINERRGNQVVVTNSVNQQSFNQQKAKFKKEALRLANLNHPNLVKVHEFFEENGTAYYVMDYIDGESLRTKLNRDGCLSEKLVLKYMQQLLPALEVAHKQSIWHLDIKPENIMVDRYGHAYLIDFGASKHIERSGTLTTSLALAYTPGYCAPELTDLLNESEEGFAEAMREIGPWTDIYSVGATMYNLLTDSIPPSSKRIERNGRNAFSFSSDMSSSIKDLIIWMMKPKREERPQMVRDIHKRQNQAKKNDERTILEENHRAGNINPSPTQSYVTSPAGNTTATGSNSNSMIGWVIGIAIAVTIGLYYLFTNNNQSLSQGIETIDGSTQAEQVAENKPNATYEGSMNPPETEKRNEIDNESETEKKSSIFQICNISESGRTCEISSVPTSVTGELIIPEHINGYSVIGIVDNAFRNCQNITSIVIPPSINEIREGTFYGCMKLTSISIPNSVNTIGAWAFADCKSLKNISIPRSVEIIGTRCFSGCSSLTTISLPNCIKAIAPHTFDGCVSLTSFTIPEGVQTLTFEVFNGCIGLRTIILPSSLNGIGSSNFKGCTSLEKIISKMESPCNYYENEFYNCYLIVPYGTKEKYEEKGYNKHFSAIVEQ